MDFILKIVKIKFTTTKIHDNTARCREKVVKSTDAPMKSMKSLSYEKC